MVRRLVWVILALLAAYLVFIGGGWLGIYASDLRALTLVLAAMTLGIWAAVAWRRPPWRPRSALAPAIAICLASLTISTILSRNRSVSVEYLCYAIVLVALYLLLVRILESAFFGPRMVRLASLLFVFLSIEFVAAVLWLWIGWWDVLGYVTLPPLRPSFVSVGFGNPSAVLTVAVLLAVPAAATIGSTTRRSAVGIGAIGLTIAVIALLSGSRAGWFALLLTALIGGLAWLSSAVNRATLRGLVGVHALVPLSIALIAAVGAGIILLPAIASRFNEGSEALRSTYAVVALRTFAQSPIVGTGPGTWVIERLANTMAGEPDIYIPHAHDVPVQTAAELGLVGLVAGATLVIGVGRLIVRAIRSTDGRLRRWGWAAGLGLMYFAFHQLLDFYANMPAALFAAAIPVAYLDAHSVELRLVSRPSAPSSRIRARLVFAAVTVAVAVAIAVPLAAEAPARAAENAVGLADTGDWVAADARARIAVAADPAIGAYDLIAGLTAARAGDHAAAATYFAQVAATDDLPEAWLDLAAEQVALGRSSEALASLRSALRLGSQRPEVAVPAGDVLLRLGDRELAIEAFAAALADVPSLTADPWWSSDRDRAALRPAIVERALGAAPTYLRWEIALMDGQADRATGLLTQAIDPGFDALVVRAWSGDSVALAGAIASCRQNPLNRLNLAWCARLASRAGNAPEAQMFRTVADVIVVGTGDLGMELRVDPQSDPTRDTRSAAVFWGIYTYRRPVPGDLLVPGLVHLRLT